VRADPDQFILMPGHADSSVERVVSEDETLMVVEKAAERVGNQVAAARKRRRQ
jgi:hypothetical protein